MLLEGFHRLQLPHICLGGIHDGFLRRRIGGSLVVNLPAATRPAACTSVLQRLAVTAAMS